MFLLGDFISRIKNGFLVKKESVLVRKSKYILSIVNILYREGYISGFSLYKINYVKIFLKYYENKSLIKDIFLVSTPGRRIYVNYKKLIDLSRKGTFFILTNSDGVVSNKGLLLTNRKNNIKEYKLNYINIVKKINYNKKFIIKNLKYNYILLNRNNVLFLNYINNNNIYKMNVNKYLNRFFIQFNRNFYYNIYYWLNFLRFFNIINYKKLKKFKSRYFLYKKYEYLSKEYIFFNKNVKSKDLLRNFILTYLYNKKNIFMNLKIYKLNYNYLYLKRLSLQKNINNYTKYIKRKGINYNIYILNFINLLKFNKNIRKNSFYKILNLYRKNIKKKYNKGGELLLGIL